MKCLVIPDIHLKPEIIEQADIAMNKHNFDAAIFLGDFVDDWGKETNIGLYEETLNSVADFMHAHDNAKICLGNHDISYLWQVQESGYSDIAEITVIAILSKLMKEYDDRIAFIHKIDNVIFSHAGLTQSWLMEYCADAMEDFNYIIDKINKMNSSTMWHDDSPIWARPDKWVKFYSGQYLQIVGHSPVARPTFYPSQNLLVCDTFSTFSNGNHIGEEKFIWIDTETKTWKSVD